MKLLPCIAAALIATASFSTMAATMGGNVRVGLEDNLFIAPGEFAKSSAQQVESISKIIHELRHDIASPDEARAILGLRVLDPLDAEPTAAWKGTVVHKVLDEWHKAGGRAGELLARASEELAAMQAHPLVRSLWWPRLQRALEWIDAEIAAQAADGRQVLKTEIRGEMRVSGVRVHGQADRIDRMPDGSLAIIDYKTGAPPSRRRVKDGFALQLGLIGLIAAADGFPEISGDPEWFEYWSLAKRPRSEGGQFGYVFAPFRTDRADGLEREDFLDASQAKLDEAIARFILGNEPFAASLQPDLYGYNEYDQLMRLDEWQARGRSDGAGA